MAEAQNNELFDYIVVGGGTSGLVVASRLSEDNDVRVLVLEVGGDQSGNPLVQNPGMESGMLDKDEYCWNVISPPQASLNNRTIFQPSGRMLGGSSGINGRNILYPSRAIIDGWGELGNVGWSWDDLEPYYRKFSTTFDPSEALREGGHTDRYHDASLPQDKSAPIKIGFGRGIAEANTAWIDTFDNLGLRMTADPRKGATSGAFQAPMTVDPTTGQRSYATTGYLDEKVRQRPNLTVLTESAATRIILERTGSANTDEVKATGVIVRSGGKETAFHASHEVVLTAGTLRTPQILEISGIGGRDLLEKHGITVQVDNPNVGEHLQDHPMTCVCFEVEDHVPSADKLRDPAVLQAAMAEVQTGGGLLTKLVPSVAYLPLVDGSGVMSAQDAAKLCEEYLSSSASTSKDPDFTQEKEIMQKIFQNPQIPVTQLMYIPAQVTIPDHPSNMLECMAPTAPENYCTIGLFTSHPLSRGACHIVSASVDDQPLWDPRYNAEALDIEIAARALQFVENQLIKTEPFAGVLRAGGRRLPDIVPDSLERAKEVISKRQMAAHHVSGTCRMRPREAGGVVDERLRVHGVKGLRIADASVFPFEPLGNILSTVYAVAERAADFIKEDRRARQG